MNNKYRESSNQLLDAFKSSMLFNQLDSKHLETLTLDFSHFQQHFQKGSLIYCEGDLCKHMDLIVQGTLIIQQIDADGNMLSITKFNKGQTLAGNILFNKTTRYPMTISAIDDVILLPLTKEDILQLCKNEDFLLALLEDISARAAILSHTIKNITRKSLRLKLIDYLTLLQTQQKSYSVILPATKTDLANTFGVARPSLSREFTLMQKDGLLSYNRNTILLSQSFIQLYL